MKKLLILTSLLLGSQIFGQQKTDMSQVDLQEYKPILLPVEEQSVYPNDELVVPLKAYNHKGTFLLYSFSWTFDGSIDQEKQEFHWIPSENQIGNHAIIFTATDTITGQSVSQPTIITVKERQYRPVLEIKSNRPLPGGFLTLNEGEDLALVIQTADRNESDRLTLGYYIDNETDKKLRNARFEANEKVATFLWTPDNRDARKKTTNITFFVEDNTGLRSEKTLPVLVNDVIHQPTFGNKTHEYFIDEGEILSFNVTATDGDNEPLTYKVITTDIKQNDFYFDPNSGRFQWKPTYEYANEKTDFQLIFSASDDIHTVYDTITVRVDPKNYPPEIEPIREREVRENEELIIRLVVSDKNGDENLTVSVVESDFEGFEFDPEKRLFKWRPPFTFVDRNNRRTVQVKFRVSDAEFERDAVAKIQVIDREDPKETQQSFIKTLASARQLSAEVGEMDENVKYTLERKRYWNTFFDISTIVVGAFTGIASSPIASEKLQKSAVPIAGAATTLFGIRAVIDKSSDKINNLQSRILILKGNVDLAINAIVRDYGENPSLTTTDSYAFKKDFATFKKNIETYEEQKERLKTEYFSLSIKEKKE